MKKYQVAVLLGLAFLLSGCLNVPTQPDQISGAYVSGFKYEKYSFDQLSVEFDSLSRREAQLVAAQNQRIKSSEVQEFWAGYGMGDGIEASELAVVRGEKEAVRREMDRKRLPPTPTDQK